jgi:hypothetical protein
MVIYLFVHSVFFFCQETHLCWAWWSVPVISALRRLRQENGEFQARMGCVVRTCLKEKEEEGGRRRRRKKKKKRRRRRKRGVGEEEEEEKKKKRNRGERKKPTYMTSLGGHLRFLSCGWAGAGAQGLTSAPQALFPVLRIRSVSWEMELHRAAWTMIDNLALKRSEL